MPLLLVQELGNIKLKESDKRKRHYVVVKCSYCSKEITVRKDYYKNSESCGCMKNIARADKKMKKFIGDKFGRLTIIEDLGLSKSKTGYTQRMVRVDCECGKKSLEINFNSIKRGLTTSCGCRQKEIVKEQMIKVGSSNIKHGMASTRLYKIWDSMKDRCYREKHKFYHRYGGRGIKVCDEWLGEEGFNNFMNWSVDNGYDLNFDYELLDKKDRLTIDRIDNDKGYYPENCQYLTLSENSSKRRK